MPYEYSPRAARVSALPKMRILVVEDNEADSTMIVTYLENSLHDYYELTLLTEKTVTDAMRQLRTAVEEVRILDAVLLDYHLPMTHGVSAKPDKTLAEFCAGHRDCFPCVAHLTDYANDKELIELWSKIDLNNTSVRALPKIRESLSKIVQAIRFREVKVPLHSAWLAADLGAVQAPINRPGEAPRSFNIYQFVGRLGDIWPALDDESKKRAEELFFIEPGASPMDYPRRIGFRSFASAQHP